MSGVAEPSVRVQRDDLLSGHYRQIVTLDYLEKNAQTGDIILLSGIGTMSKLVRLFSRSRWSHVAVLIRLESQNNQLFVLETSNGYSEEDVLAGATPQTGVHMWPIQHLAGYRSYAVCWRRLHVPAGWRESLPWRVQVLRFIERIRGRIYDTHLIEMFETTREPSAEELGASTGRPLTQSHDALHDQAQKQAQQTSTIPYHVSERHLNVLDKSTSQELYCTELVLLFFQAMNLLSTDRAATHYNLEDLSEEDSGHRTDIQLKQPTHHTKGSHPLVWLGQSHYILEMFDDFEPPSAALPVAERLKQHHVLLRRDGMRLKHEFQREFS